jgi:hypothetical protein
MLIDQFDLILQTPTVWVGRDPRDRVIAISRSLTSGASVKIAKRPCSSLGRRSEVSLSRREAVIRASSRYSVSGCSHLCTQYSVRNIIDLNVDTNTAYTGAMVNSGETPH